ncbi:protein C-mannosyl-transferase DPY19L3 isoform X2 [Tiliqua scincoides]|uniref:protein C-mannosyl-transferase DPY19L3 isoform X2 n=1 Tax=Tiliqua scincoides TaxID=71010 RepID=UPI0034622EF3
MSGVRQRRGARFPAVPGVFHNTNWDLYWELVPGRKPWKKISFISGGIVGISLGILTAVYVATLHENEQWFSNISEVEREISFRTECGLYYSYYKQMLQAPSILRGLQDLIYDNKTESLRIINILKRMNVYQEVYLSILYRIFPIENYLEPVYFYIYTLFGLQAVYVGALYVTSWLLSGTWLSGALAAIWYITNRLDTTRVEFSIALRENWALPFFAVQVAAITFLFRPHLHPLFEGPTLLAVFISTFLFSLTWQFNQFILLIQALVLFSLDCLDLLPNSKVTSIYIIQVASLLLVYFLQFFNSMIIGSLFLSFNISCLLARRFQKKLKTGSFFTRLGKLFLHVPCVLCSTLLINASIKRVFKLDSDEHIFKFLKAKFGFGATRDFDANLYLCETAFGFLPSDTFMRLKDTLVFHSYMFVLLVMIFATAAVAFHNLSGNIRAAYILQKCIALLKPGAAYNLVHTILFGLLALSTMRMKYLWTSHMCVFAASGLCNGDMWGLILRLFNLHTPRRVTVMRYLTPILIIFFLFYKFWPGMKAELSKLAEFYDPDTVDLMNWIKFIKCMQKGPQKMSTGSSSPLAQTLSYWRTAFVMEEHIAGAVDCVTFLM